MAFRNLVMFLLLISTVSAISIPSGQDYTLINLDNAYNCKAKVVQQDVVDDYSLVGCELQNNIWNCQCEDKFNYILRTKQDSKNVYTITLQYNSQPLTNNPILDDAYKRTKMFEIQTNGAVKTKYNLTQPKQTITETFKQTLDNNKGTLLNGILIIISVIVIIIGIVIIIYKYLEQTVKNDGDTKDYTNEL